MNTLIRKIDGYRFFRFTRTRYVTYLYVLGFNFSMLGSFRYHAKRKVIVYLGWHGRLTKPSPYGTTSCTHCGVIVDYPVGWNREDTFDPYELLDY